MPNEIRRLVFFNSEITDALHVYGEKNNAPFPQGKVIRAKIASDPEADLHTQHAQATDLLQQYNVRDLKSAITVTFFAEETYDHRHFHLPSEFISAALIQYCVDNNIPMPRNGKKKLDITEFNVCMDIVIEDEQDADLELVLE